MTPSGTKTWAAAQFIPAAARPWRWFLVAPIAGARVNRIGERPLIIGGLLLAATGLASIARRRVRRHRQLRVR
jgi:hypothetical protein